MTNEREFKFLNAVGLLFNFLVAFEANQGVTLNETKLDPNILKCHTDIDGYHHERFDRNRHGGGVCVYTEKVLLTTKYTLTLQIMSWKPFVLK